MLFVRNRELLGRKRMSCKDIKMYHTLPWPVVIWGVDLVQTWPGRTVSTFWSLSISQPSEQGVRLSDVSVWVTIISCSRFPTSCRIGGLRTGEWFLVWPKGLWSLHKASFSHSRGDSWGLFSLFFWFSHSFSEKEVNFWLVEWDYPHIWPSAASSHSWELKVVIQMDFLQGRQTQGLVSWEPFSTIKHVS